MQLEADERAAKQMRLPWWGVLMWMALCATIVWPFEHFRRMDLARPTLYGIGMIGVAVAVKWRLRQRMWFWVAIMLFAALHVFLIVFVPWTTKWVPAVVLIPVGIADLYGMLAILAFVEKRMWT